MIKNTWHVQQVVVLVVAVGEPDLGVRLAGGLELRVGRHLRLVRILAQARRRVHLRVVRAHVVHTRDGVTWNEGAR